MRGNFRTNGDRRRRAFLLMLSWLPLLSAWAIELPPTTQNCSQTVHHHTLTSVSLHSCISRAMRSNTFIVDCG
jgi:hypothetical protein